MQRLCAQHMRIFVSVAALAAIGCPKPTPKITPKPPPRYASTTLRVAVPEGQAKALVERHSRAWCGETGAKVQLVASDAPDADLRLIAPAELPRLASAGGLAPLPNPEAISRLLPLYASRLVTWDGKAYALPIRGESLFLLYRLSEYRDAGLKPPSDWADFAEQAATLAKKLAKPSLPPLPTSDDDLDREFHAIASSYACKAVAGAVSKATVSADQKVAGVFAFDYDPTTGLPRIDGPGFVEALELMQRLQPFRGTSFANAVLGLASLDELSALRGTADKWGVTRVPGSKRVNGAPLNESFANVVPYVGHGGTLGVVSRGSPNIEAAFDLLQHLSGEAVSMEVVHEPEFSSGPFREPHLGRRTEGWSNYGLGVEATSRLREVLRERADPRIDNPALVLRLPNAREHAVALAVELRRALTGGATAADALKAAAAKWREIDGDPAATREAYKRGLGL
ncbi:MAG: extracellular solute-binding protein [Gemmataceae bacterium]